ncbi:serine/threonine-protein phosphatase [Nocardioides humilatus]|uniref:Serine/threonine-protein phosphatase n=1 Tax=Nocardioides humilatus TaxID=2607660 RepID=A0A5B1LN64_9ACTN|nr:protein phosphatase 2C domain-containing protein [Nocardioides humilatus]KAA1421548.1 serine/threonine-protein phosphatase [Nocardioides humilatus]
MSPLRIEVRAGAATHAGNLRSENQDAHLINPPVFLVADGMGGHASGREASELVAMAFDHRRWGQWVTPTTLKDATAAAAAAVGDLGRRVSGAPGSTLTGAGLAVHDDEPCWLIFNIGDSRTYLLRDEELEQVTVDHSQRQALMDAGLTSTAAAASAKRNVITQAIGGGLATDPELDLWMLPARPGDRVLLCSDGLSGEVSDPLIAVTLLSTPDPQAAAAALVAAAVAGAGRDNVTAVVVDAVLVEGHRSDQREWATDDTVDETTARLSGDTQPDLEVVP